MTTVYDVAKEASVSIATVSRVFNNLASVSASTRDKVKLAAEKLDYTPHAGARNLMIKRTDTIGAILPDVYGQFFSEFVKGLDSAARERGLHLLLSCSHDDAEEMAAALSAMRGRVDGVVVMSPLIGADAFQKYVPEDIPIVVVNGGKQHTRYPSICFDNDAGARRMTEHLLSEGHRHIVLISGPAGNQDAQQRQLGYERALREGCSDSAADVIQGDFSEESGYRAAEQILGRTSLPDAIFASNDAMAIGCLSALNDRGVAVPRDIALAGFDDIPLARYVRPSLSSVGVSISEIGSKSLDVLVEKLKREPGENTADEYLFAPSLIIRDSSRRA